MFQSSYNRTKKTIYLGLHKRLNLGGTSGREALSVVNHRSLMGMAVPRDGIIMMPWLDLTTSGVFQNEIHSP
jgi:hypothetical protein